MRFAILPGDGIGPEITASTVEILKRVDQHLGLGLEYQEFEVGLAALKRVGTTTPDGVLDACRAADGIVLGPVSHSDYPARAQGGINISAELRVVLDLYANIRPSRSREGLPHYGRTPMDLVIVRENTEGFYSDRNMFQGIGEFMPTPDLALSVRKITAHGSRRIARAAFELARQRARRKVTAVHKANVIKVSEALFALKTNGGSEKCAWVIGDSLEQLSWSADNRDLKTIFIAGNEPFDQGPKPYAKACEAAVAKGVAVNTIFCGGHQEGADTK